jgi:2-iminobutanoate/2-iminopropanoate deaminase
VVKKEAISMGKGVQKFGSVIGVASPRASYSTYTKVGNLVFVAGQVATDLNSGEIPKEFDEQLRLVLSNIRTILKSAGSSMDNILKTTVFLKDASHHVSYDKIYKEFFGNGYPARSTVVADLMHPDFLVEIEAVAWAPD